MKVIASCMNCDWTGTFTDGQVHDDDEHLVVYNAVEPEASLAEVLGEWDDDDVLPCGCGH